MVNPRDIAGERKKQTNKQTNKQTTTTTTKPNKAKNNDKKEAGDSRVALCSVIISFDLVCLWCVHHCRWLAFTVGYVTVVLSSSKDFDIENGSMYQKWKIAKRKK